MTATGGHSGPFQRLAAKRNWGANIRRHEPSTPRPTSSGVVATLKVLAGVLGLLLIAVATGPLIAILVALGLIVGLLALKGR